MQLDATDVLGGELNERRQTHPDGSVERWRDVVNYEGRYRVSDRGRVKSVAWTVRSSDGHVYQVRGRVLSPRANRRGHLHVGLSKDGARRMWAVHRVVLLAFRGPPPPGMECRHFPDRNPANNRPENLQWGTRAENVADMVVHGTAPIGERNASAKIKDVDVGAIHVAYRSGETSTAIAGRYEVDPHTVRNVLNGHAFPHCQPTGRTKMRQRGPLPGQGVGEQNSNAKLTEEAVREIRRLRAAGGYTLGRLARMFGVHLSLIGYVVQGKIWRHVS
jgi:hypothetical protein